MVQYTVQVPLTRRTVLKAANAILASAVLPARRLRAAIRPAR